MRVTCFSVKALDYKLKLRKIMKNTPKWKVSQIVKLNTGSPDMTINQIITNIVNEFNEKIQEELYFMILLKY